MLDSNRITVNEKGHLTIGGVDAVSIAKEYKTPLYVMDENLIRENCRRFLDSMKQYYQGEGMVCYASKAFCCKKICRIMKDEGMGLDVVSGGELYTAISVDFPMSRICFHGNNKTEDELTLAISHGVGRIVVDNFSELTRLSQLAERLHKKASIMLRIKPGIDAHTHSFIRTGQIDSKFGFALETGEALEAVRSALSSPNILLKGVHCHIGSQIFDLEPFEHAAEVMLGFIFQVQEELDYDIRELNLGGGFGIAYLSEDKPAPYEEYMRRVSEVIHSICKKKEKPVPFVLIEPGRSIVGPAGTTLYTAGSIKEIPGVRTYVSVDGGMTDNPRYILYQAEYEAVVANRAAEEKDAVVTLAGKCCESGDLIGEHLPIQKVQEGDILAVLATGAYNYSMSSNYNRIPRPAVVMVRNGKTSLAVKRENMEDLLRCDL